MDDKKLRLSQQFCEMFTHIPKDHIIEIAEECEWQAEPCIDRMIAYSKQISEGPGQHQGAIPKITNAPSTSHIPENRENTNSKQHSPEFTKTTKKQQLSKWHSTQELEIGDKIRAGYRVMILMRGPPGCGKTYLAQSLVKNYVQTPYNMDLPKFIFSTDDYFYNSDGIYRHNANLLSVYHEYNLQRVKQHASLGWSPIFVDNTNMQIWHMLPYVQTAVRHGYILEVLEPNTPWRNKVSELVTKNRHYVTRETIENMLMRWEPTNPEKLIRMLNKDKYTLPLPQMRLHPPFAVNSDTEKEENINDPLSEKTIEQSQLCNDGSSNRNSDNTNIKCKWNERYRPSPLKQRKIKNYINHNKDDDATYRDTNSQYHSDVYIDKSSSDNSSESQANEMACSSIASGEGSNTDFDRDVSITDEGIDCYKNGNSDASELCFSDKVLSSNTQLIVSSHMVNKKRTEEELQLNEQREQQTINESYRSHIKEEQIDRFSNEGEISKDSSSMFKQNLVALSGLDDNLNNPTIVRNSGTSPDLIESINRHKSLLKENKFERHSIDCPNESLSFMAFRQIYPNKSVDALWDLFVKCDGDVDWAVDILMREEESVLNNDGIFSEGMRSNSSDVNEVNDDFQCSCAKSTVLETNNSTSLQDTHSPTSIKSRPLPQRRTKYMRNFKRNNNRHRELEQVIANNFTLADDKYSEHVQKIRKMRHVNANASISVPLIPSTEVSIQRNANAETQTDMYGSEDGDIEENDQDIDESTDSDDSDKKHFEKNQVTLKLGGILIEQLIDLFKDETPLIDLLPDTMPENVNVFLPRSLAKRIYLVYLESVYHHKEMAVVEQKDEDFARLLKLPKYAECKEMPHNTQEILDMELAWDIYKQDNKEITQKKEMCKPDMATYLKQLKLFELFPDIPRDIVIDILAAHGNRYGDTVSILASSSFNSNNKSKYLPTKTPEQLILFANREKDLLKKEVAKHRNGSGETSDIFTAEGDLEKGRRLAHETFNESRNLAAHHGQLKYESHIKAKEAAVKGEGATAAYYANLARLHSRKIELFNQKAASCIIDVHKYTHDNPELLDLHYFFIPEALQCLDIFLDCHISQLRNTSHNCKEVFIITGRGRHSVGGVANIKNRVQNRLMERKLKWVSENAGLLKVKLFSSSKFAKRSTKNDQ